MYRTKIELTVLSEEPIPEDAGLDYVLAEAYDGDYVMTDDWGAPEKISEEEMADALVAAGSDPEFFQINQ